MSRATLDVRTGDRAELRDALAWELVEARVALRGAIERELALLECLDALDSGNAAAIERLGRDHASTRLALITASERFGDLLRAATAVQQTPQAQA